MPSEYSYRIVLSVKCNASIHLSPKIHLVNTRQTSTIEESSNVDTCFVLSENKTDYFMQIDVHRFSLLIDLEQAEFDLSWYNRFKYSKNDEYSVSMIFVEGEELINENKFLTGNNFLSVIEDA